MQGWIKLYRKMLEWEWYKDINTKVVFLHLLLSANIRDVKYMGMIVKKGSFITKRTDLARDLNLTENEIRTALNHLKNTGEILIKTTNKFSVITIVNYSGFQELEDEKSPANHQQITNKSPTINQLLTSLEEEGKEEKEFKNRDIVSSNADGTTEKEKISYKKYLELYKQNIKSLPIPKILSDKRKKALKTLTMKLSDDDIANIFKKAEESDFLSGRNGKWSGCSFDWLINYNNALKVLEGQYDNKEVKTQSKSRFNNYEQRKFDPVKMRELEKMIRPV